MCGPRSGTHKLARSSYEPARLISRPARLIASERLRGRCQAKSTCISSTTPPAPCWPSWNKSTKARWLTRSPPRIGLILRRRPGTARVVGLQIDIDVPTRLLSRYAKILRALRAQLKPGSNCRSLACRRGWNQLNCGRRRGCRLLGSATLRRRDSRAFDSSAHLFACNVARRSARAR